MKESGRIDGDRVCRTGHGGAWGDGGAPRRSRRRERPDRRAFQSHLFFVIVIVVAGGVLLLKYLVAIVASPWRVFPAKS